ncbi:MAG: hypothetical protein HWD61_05865 [Parachlamydiaceae bacterium]|nr:MAG: hypothetical protein HWD61_05865 [Parachlamydiaceae bacterium]
MMKDSYSRCYPILMTVQCAIESFLTRELYAQNIRNVHALVLSQEGFSSQLKHAQVKGLVFEKFDHSRELTFDPRDITLPYLCEAGAMVQWAYSTKLQNQLEPETTSKAHSKKGKWKNYKNAAKKDVPFELSGTLYRFEGWIIVIHGNSELHKNTNEGVWKIWMAPDNVNSEALEHAHAMEQFVLKNASDK